MGRAGLGVLLAAIAVLVAVAVWIAGPGTGSSAGGEPAPTSGSTLEGTWLDIDGDGFLERGSGEPLRDRVDLAPASDPVRTLATLVQITDSHVRDEESPARASLLDRLDPDLNSTFRPQEALSAQVLAATLESTDQLAPDAVLLTGDLIDNAQRNELDLLLDVIAGNEADPDAGAPGYEGPQESDNPDPFFYRPDLDAPRHPGLLEDASETFSSPGLNAPWYPLVGNHDLLVQGEVPATSALESLATGDRLLTGLRRGLLEDRDIDDPSDPSDPGSAELPAESALSPELVDEVIGSGLPGPTRRVAADSRRSFLTPSEAVEKLADASNAPASAGSGRSMDYTVDVGEEVRVIALDLVSREGGSGGIIAPGQPRWLREQLRRAGDRTVLVMTHQPIDGATGGERLLAALDRSPKVLATLAGDTHSNSIDPRPTASGGYWEIQTSSLADYPQQARALRVVETEGGGIALETWMLDGTGSPLADTARELGYLDAQGGRPQGNAGEPGDRNVRLFR